VLAEFLVRNRDAIVADAQARLAARPYARTSGQALAGGIAAFLDQLGDALRLATSTDVIDHAQLSESAGRHGRDLVRRGLSIAQVVHDYGDIGQAITQLAVQQDTPISASEHRTLDLCLDQAIAEAVTEYAGQRERAIVDQGTERLGVLAHELRNLLNTAMLSFETIAAGHVPPGGSTGVILGRSLAGLRDLVDRSLADVRLDAGIESRDPISVADLVEEIEIGALLQARSRDLHFMASTVDRAVWIEGDRQILAAAVANLLQNAFKFSRKQGAVSLTTRVSAERVLFEIEDECGGLPEGASDVLFRPFEQAGADRTGLGLGLSICLKAAHAHGGVLRVRDVPGRGCIFTLDLPRAPLPAATVVDAARRRPTSDDAPGGARTASDRDA
jgi:signal transduction histidine kinase